MDLPIFSSSNYNKYLEIRSMLQSSVVNLEFCELKLNEIQSDSIEEIAFEKSNSAYKQLSRPVIVEDDGLFIDELNGFPGQYSSYVYKTIENKGILKLLRNAASRSAVFKSLFVFYDGKNYKTFNGERKGRISCTITHGGWGYDPIFIPDGSRLSFGQLHLLNRKIEFSHRAVGLRKFVEWYTRRLNENEGGR